MPSRRSGSFTYLLKALRLRLPFGGFALGSDSAFCHQLLFEGYTTLGRCVSLDDSSALRLDSLQIWRRSSLDVLSRPAARSKLVDERLDLSGMHMSGIFLEPGLCESTWKFEWKRR